ncbi:MAG TPA: hypothetical protein VI997_12240, partial [Candidatus Thermoplasmatota archaeon]|nr:hypothetical protein [Candidatus Thermoplasmatota archaeon]
MGTKGRARSRLLVAAAFALLMLPHPYVEAQGPRPAEGVLARNVAYEWWGPTDATGWHFRVPLAVFPRFPDPLTKFGVTSGIDLFETPVQVEVDFTSLLRDTNLENRTGWPMDEFGRLSSFTFDPATVRVIAYDRATGRVEAGSGRAGSIPYLFTTALYENSEARNPVFNATQNAIGTVQFVIPRPFDRERLYFLYFDTRENGPKPPTEWTEVDLAPLRGQHFVRAGTDFYGYLPSVPGLPQPRISIWGIHDNTTVAMYRYRYVGFEAQEVPPCQRKGTVGLCLTGGRIETGVDPDHLNLAGLSNGPA